MKQSMSRPGCPYDNSPVESFFSSLKRECIHRKKYTSIKEVEKDLFQYIGLFYNRKRLHSFLDYKSPINYKLEQRQLNLTALIS
jgi:transposase InsO family protein